MESSRRVVSLPFHYQRKVAGTSITGYSKSTERGIQSSGLACAITSIANVAGNTWRITLSGAPATVDISPLSVGDVIECYSTGSANWDSPLLFPVTAFNIGANTIDVTNTSGAAIGAVGSIRAFIGIPVYTYGYQRGVMFNAASIEKASHIVIRDPYISVQASQGVAITDTQLDFITIFYVQCRRNPFRSLYEGIGVNLNVYATRSTGALTHAIAAGNPDQIESKAILAPSDLVLENRHVPAGNNLYLETSSGDLTEYQKVNLEEWVEKLDPVSALAVPITPSFSQQLRLEHRMKVRKGAECLLVFCSIGNENTSGDPQLIKGRTVFDLEVR